MAEAEEERTPTALEYMHRIGPDLLEQIVKVYRDNKFVADSDSLRPHGQQQTPVQAMLSVLPDTADHRAPAALFDYLDALVPEEEPTRTAFNKNWGRALPGTLFSGGFQPGTLLRSGVGPPRASSVLARQVSVQNVLRGLRESADGTTNGATNHRNAHDGADAGAHRGPN